MRDDVPHIGIGDSGRFILMRRKLVTALGLGLLMAAAAAGRADGKPVKFSSGGREISGFLFTPAGAGPFPAMVEVHGIYGREPWDAEVSEKLAAEGYVTLSVDLYGRNARNYDDGLHLRDGVRPRVAEDLRAAVAYLRT